MIIDSHKGMFNQRERIEKAINYLHNKGKMKKLSEADIDIFYKSEMIKNIIKKNKIKNLK